MKQVRDALRFIQTLEDMLRRGHQVRFRADGWSMYPAIRSGEMITVEPLGGSPIGVGDVLLYRRGRAVIAHRVVRMRSSSGRLVERRQRNPRDPRLVLQGDAADCCDEPIGPEQVLGRVVAVERAGRRGRRGVPSLRWSRLLAYALRGAHAIRVKITAVMWVRS
jgi:hypothetical protein